jgi:hypothetical protein
MKKYETIVEKDENNELVIPFDEELMLEIDWEVGDIIQWSENENGSFTLTRVEK